MNATNITISLFTILFGISIVVSQDGGTESSLTVNPDRIHLIAPDQDKSTAFSYYNTSPESPDGSKIAYVAFDRVEDMENVQYITRHNSPLLSGALWVYDKMSQTHHRVVPIDRMLTHNGAFAQWIDSRRIAYTDNDAVKVVEIETGQIVFGPVPGAIGHDTNKERILLEVRHNESKLEKGVYQVDVNTGEKTLKIRTRDLAAYEDQLGSNTDPVETWFINHAQWSPNGDYVAMALHVKEVFQTEQERILISMKADGSDIKIFGPKPMHFLWYDNQTIFGHDNQIDDGNVNDRSLRRWDREARYVETLAGPGNHGAGSPNRRWFASENWYNSDPVILKLYEKGNTEPSRIVFQHSYPEQVWIERHHVNPSFSRDSKRLYFNYAINDSTTQAAYYDLEVSTGYAN